MALFEKYVVPAGELDFKIPTIYFSNIIPFPGFKAINLFGVLFVRKKHKEAFKRLYSQRQTLNHEYIHTLQMKEMLYIFFYLWYFLEWLYQAIASIFTKKVLAYRMICFEQEAYANENNFDYTKTRPAYAFLHYVGVFKKF